MRSKILSSRRNMEIFLERFDSYDPLEDWYDEADLAIALAELIREKLRNEDHEKHFGVEF